MNDMESLDLMQIVMRLNGHVDPYGETNYDRESLKNLKSLIDLSDQILSKIHDASKAKDRQESSMKEIGQMADKYISGLGGWNHIG